MLYIEGRFHVDTEQCQNVNIIDVARKLGMHLVQKQGRVYTLCPFHNDRKIGSAIVGGKKNIFTCFSCGTVVGTIKLVQKVLGLEDRTEFPKVMMWFIENFPHINYELLSDEDFNTVKEVKKLVKLSYEEIKELGIQVTVAAYIPSLTDEDSYVVPYSLYQLAQDDPESFDTVLVNRAEHIIYSLFDYAMYCGLYPSALSFDKDIKNGFINKMERIKNLIQKGCLDENTGKKFAQFVDQMKMLLEANYPWLATMGKTAEPAVSEYKIA